MIQQERGKRHTTKSLPRGVAPGRRRGLWLMIGVSLLIFIVIVVFETQHELARQRQLATPEGGSETELPTSAAVTEPITLLGRLKEHYRSHDLPRGWTVGEIVAPTETAATVRIVFSPSPQDARYGQAAPAEDIFKSGYCPQGAAFWSGLEDREVTVELGDKGGPIMTIACGAAVTN